MNQAQRYRVRPWLRNMAIVSLVVLAPIATHALWDLIEARRLSAAIEGIRARGEMVYWTEWQARTPSPEEKLAGRYYTAAAILARDAYSAKFRGIRDIIAAIATLPPRDTARDPRLAQLQRVLDEYAPMLDLLDRAHALASGEIRSGDELRSPVADQNLANVNAVPDRAPVVSGRYERRLERLVRVPQAAQRLVVLAGRRRHELQPSPVVDVRAS